MSFISTLPDILKESKREYEKLKQAPIQAEWRVTEVVNGNSANTMARGDNLAFMRYLTETHTGKFQVIYIDPPFYSKANYDAVIRIKPEGGKEDLVLKPTAYNDVWNEGMGDYLKMLCIRFYFLKDLLCREGCFWVHLDWHVVHYAKVLLDEIFGAGNFVNEVIWNYKSGGASKRSFSKKHDTLLFYSKTKHYYFHPLQEKSYNRGLKPYNFSGVKEYKDETGWYTKVNMKDVWQLDMVGRTSSERTGYATQKPEVLLERIIESCSREGDLCGDFFGGSGTLAAVADKKKRNWVYCDGSGIAIANSFKRLVMQRSAFALFEEDTGADSHKLDVHLEREGNQIVVSLKAYEATSLPVNDTDKREINRLLKKNPLELVQYWSVDFCYNGSVHRPQFFAVKEKRLTDMCRGTGVQGGKISIHVMDLFGNKTFKILDLGGENE